MNRLLKGILFIWLFCPAQLAAQPLETDIEEIFVFVRVQGVGGMEMDAIYRYDSDEVFLPVIDLFNFLRIKYESQPGSDIISGFLVSEGKNYRIDYQNRQVEFEGHTYSLQEGELMKTDLGIFMKSTRFGDIFGLHTSFNFRALSIEIRTELQLPAIREMRLEQFRKNIDQLQGDVEVDTTLFRKYHLLRLGMVDWNINSTQSTQRDIDTRVQFGVGAEVLGGETQLQLNYSSLYGFNSRNQSYYWRWANNKSPLLRQVRVGRVQPGFIASVYDPVLGISATNAPTSYRRSYGSYTISDNTEPGWSVELYVNNVLVDYQTADASGFYSFDIPLVYGSSQIMTKFYGPYGEERIKEQFLNVPFNFLPRGEMEYTISGGVVLDEADSRFGVLKASYGVNRWLTAGGGIEHLSSIPGQTEIPFLSASVRPLGFLMLTGEYAHEVRSRALMNVKLPSSMNLELDYVWYKQGQKAIRFNYLEERKASFSSPLQLFTFRGYSRISIRQSVYKYLTHNTADLTLSTYMGSMNINLSTYANWVSSRSPYVYSNITGGYRFRHGFTLRPQLQVDYTNKRLVHFRAEIEKRVSRSGYLALTGEENFRSHLRSVSFSMRWNLPFAQTSFSARYSGDEFISSQGAGGSLAFGSGRGYVHVANSSGTGRGGVSVYPFLDLNHNGEREKTEPLVGGMAVRMSGGRVLQDHKDTIIRIIELEPYTSYVLTLDDASLEEISWQITNKAIRVEIDPNQFKKVEIPIRPMGEANGWVMIEDDTGARGQGRILVNFYREDGTYITRTMTESDGGFTLLGLPPGKLYATIDPVQLERLNLIAMPEQIPFEMKQLPYGDIVYDL
ncbi:MAG: hypothetical protein WDA19_13090, partial [Mariniphaga sp.]